MRSFISSFLALGLLLSTPSFAADVKEPAEAAPVIPTPLKVMPSKIKPVQSNTDELSKAAPEDHAVVAADNKALEILSPRPEYGFQNDFWKGMSRQDIVAFLNKPSVASSGRAVRDLILRVALTPPAALSESKNPDENIYALRLQKLVNLGAFDDAQKLYKLNETDPPTPLAAQAGIESSFGHGEIAVACLDQKTFDNALKSVSPAFWSHVDAFCQALLSPAAGNDDALRLSNASRAYLEITKPTAATVNDVNQLDIISTIAMMESGQLSVILNNPANLSVLDDKHLGLLLAYAKPSATTLPLLAEGLSRGLVSNDKALTFMKAVDLTDVTNPYAPFLKEYFKTPDSPLVTDQLLTLTTDKTRESLLCPLYSAAEIAFPEGSKKLSLQLLSLTNQDVPASLVKSAYGINESPENPTESSETGEKILIKLLIDKAKTGGVLPPENGNLALLALDYANYPQNDIKNAYDNLLNLTPNGNYVMPIHDILSSLKKSANQKQTNQVVIRSLAIIDDKPLEQLHPAVLYQILEALNSAGLNEETTSLTREVLGIIIRNYKEK